MLGSLSLPLSELLVADRLCLDRWFTLSSGQGQVLLRAQLGVSPGPWAGGGGWEQKPGCCYPGAGLFEAHTSPARLDPGVPALRGGSSQP